MRILHVLDHSLPLQSGYVFRSHLRFSAASQAAHAAVPRSIPPSAARTAANGSGRGVSISRGFPPCIGVMKGWLSFQHGRPSIDVRAPAPRPHHSRRRLEGRAVAGAGDVALLHAGPSSSPLFFTTTPGSSGSLCGICFGRSCKGTRCPSKRLWRKQPLIPPAAPARPFDKIQSST